MTAPQSLYSLPFEINRRGEPACYCFLFCCDNHGNLSHAI